MRQPIARLLAVLCAIGTFNQSASAADLPSRDFLPAQGGNFQSLPWSGAYIGVHAGMGWAQVSPAEQSSAAIDLEGFSGGGHFGYNIQNGRIVFGLEVDADGTSIEKSETITSGTVSAKWRAGITSLASLRGRLGYAAGDTLFYGTAGVGWSQSEFGVTVQVSGLEVSAKADTSAVGYVVGGGIEHKVTTALSGRLEALYYGFQDHEIKVGNTTTKLDSNVTVLRGGLSWHFN